MSNEIPPGTKSILRNATEGPIHRAMKYVDEQLPFIKPDHITNAGVAMVGLGCVALGLSQQEAFEAQQSAFGLVGVGLTGVGVILDGLDGALARIKASRGEHDTFRGQITDAIADRRMDMLLAALRFYMAGGQDSDFGQIAALSAWTTNFGPSSFRAWAEAQGIIVPEGGRGLIQLAGTRAGRMVLNGLAIGADMAGLADVQGVVDSASSFANVAVTKARYQLGRHAKQVGAEKLPQEQQLPDNKIEQAQARLEAFNHEARVGIGLAVAAGASTLL